MKHVTILVLCIFLISISVVAFAEQTAQDKQPERNMAAETEKEDQMKEARMLPGTLISDEEGAPKFKLDIEEEPMYDYADDNPE